MALLRCYNWIYGKYGDEVSEIPDVTANLSAFRAA
jgi:hypothetical protein